MSEYVITLLAAAAVTYILTPAVRRFAIAVGAMHAARERDVHKEPTPLLGGFAIYGGLVAALLLASRLSGLTTVFTETNMAKGLLLAGALVVIMGFVDDRWGMGALSKLAGQVAAGVILVWSGAEIPWLPAPGGVTIVLTSDQQVAVTILVVVVTMNAVNFIDGLDGLAAGIVGIGAIAFFAYYFTLVHRLGLLDQSEPALVSVLLAGVCIGFLPHNFYPARIFMGDTGSMLIGLMLAYAPISSLALLDPASLTDSTAYAAGTVNRYGAFVPLVVPAAILLIPYADLLMAVVRRTRAGKSVFAPDKKHLQHRLLAIGHSHRTSVLIMYLWAAVFSGTVILLSIVRTPLFVLAIVTVVAVLLLLLVTMPRLRPWSRVTASAPAPAGRVPRRAGAASAGTAPAGTAPAGTASATTAPARARQTGAATAGVADGGTAGSDTAAAGAASGGAVPAGPAAGQEQGRPAWSGVVKAPETARGNAARAAIRARLAEGPMANGVAGNGDTPGKDAAGTGTSGNGAAPAKDRGRRNPAGNGAAGPPTPAATAEDGAGSPAGYAAGARTPAATAEDGAGSPAGYAAGPPTPAITAEDGAGSPASHSGWSWDADDTLPPRSGDQAVPPWAADDAESARSAPIWEGGRGAAPSDGTRAVPLWAADDAQPPAWSAPDRRAGRDAAPPDGTRAVPPWLTDDAESARSASGPAGGRDAARPDEARAVPPWADESTTASPEPASPVPSWDAGTATPPAETGFLAAGRSLPPWELPPETHSAVPPWVAGHGIPPWADDGAPPSAAGRSVPPWELADPDAAGPVPVLPWPGLDGSATMASDGPGHGPTAPPWPPAAPPRRPPAPPWPPAAPLRP